MRTYTNAEIAADISLWNEYFNPAGAMTDEEFHDTPYDERLQMLVEAFGNDHDPNP